MNSVTRNKRNASFVVVLVAAIAALLFAPSTANAACSTTYPVGASGDGIVSFVAANSGGTPLFAATTFQAVAEGMLTYDTTTHTLQLCDGTQWTSLLTAASGSSQWVNGTGGAIYYNGGNVGIGTSTPVASALLDVTSTTKGFLPPRVTTVQRDAIATPATGLIIFNTTTGNLEVYGGTSWTPVGSNTPNGVIAAFASTTCPSGWSEYTAARGRFLRGIDNGAGLDPDGTRAPGNTQTDALQGHYHNAIGTNTQNAGNGAYITRGSLGAWGTQGVTAGSVAGPASDGTNGPPRTASETRPANVAVTFCQYNGNGVGGGGTTLIALSDVNISSPSNGQVLTYNSTSGKWENGAGGGGGADNLGNHTAIQNIVLDTNWLSGDGGNEGIRIDSAGRVGIGIASPTEAFEVAGRVKAVAYHNSSDQRLKHDIKSLENEGMDLVRKLRGVSFVWNDSNRHAMGFIAQEIEQIVPFAVATDAKGYKSVDYVMLIAPMAEAIKTLDADLTKANAAINALKADNATLRVALEQLSQRQATDKTELLNAISDIKATIH